MDQKWEIAAYRVMCVINFMAGPFLLYVLSPPQEEAQEKVVTFALSIFGLMAVAFYEILIPIGFTREYRGSPWNPDNWRTIFTFQTVILLLVAILRNEWGILGMFALYGVGCATAIWIIKRKSSSATTRIGLEEGAGLMARLV